MGKPIRRHGRIRYTENIGVSGELGELKHLSSRGKESKNDSLSSGERKGNSPNHCVRAMGL